MIGGRHLLFAGAGEAGEVGQLVDEGHGGADVADGVA